MQVISKFQFIFHFARVHKIVVASGSKYMVEVFKAYPKMKKV